MQRCSDEFCGMYSILLWNFFQSLNIKIILMVAAVQLDLFLLTCLDAFEVVITVMVWCANKRDSSAVIIFRCTHCHTTAKLSEQHFCLKSEQSAHFYFVNRMTVRQHRWCWTFSRCSCHQLLTTTSRHRCLAARHALNKLWSSYVSCLKLWRPLTT